LLIAHRVVKARHAQTAFSGEGACIAGGRWNRPGDAVVFASASLALAAMETFVHLGDDSLHIEFVHFRYQFAGEAPAPEAGTREVPRSSLARTIFGACGP
jgi:RES domain-containing protein